MASHPVFPISEEQRTREFRDRVLKDLTPEQRFTTKLELAKDDYRRRLESQKRTELLEKHRDS